MKRSEIKITETFKDILDSGNWISFCDKYGINDWCLNEGRAKETDTIEISLEDAEMWGIVENI